MPLSHSTRVLRTKLGSSVIAVPALSHRATEPSLRPHMPHAYHHICYIPLSQRDGEVCIDDELHVLASFSSLSHFQAIKYSSTGTEHSQSQADYPESLWIFEQEEMLSIGIEEVSEIPRPLIYPAWMLLSTCPILETSIYPECSHCCLPTCPRDK